MQVLKSEYFPLLSTYLTFSVKDSLIKVYELVISSNYLIQKVSGKDFESVLPCFEQSWKSKTAIVTFKDLHTQFLPLLGTHLTCSIKRY